MNKTVTRSKRHTSHGFHLIMTLITFGAWGFVWAWMTFQNMMIKERSVSYGPAVVPVAVALPADVETPREHKPWTRERVIRTAVPALVLIVLILIVMAV
jgi:hypothetical protein